VASASERNRKAESRESEEQGRGVVAAGAAWGALERVVRGVVAAARDRLRLVHTVARFG
jgi:hypothetical protein